MLSTELIGINLGRNRQQILRHHERVRRWSVLHRFAVGAVGPSCSGAEGNMTAKKPRATWPRGIVQAASRQQT